MVEQDFSDEDVLSRLAHRPNYIIRGQISCDEDVRLSYSDLPSTSRSSLGPLAVLPLELWHDILVHLDLLSFSRFLRVNHYARVVALSLPAFRDLSSAAGYAFSVFKQTRTITHHPISRLHNVLQSSQCCFCDQYGAFFLLLMAQRCCYECLRHNMKSWLIPRALAEGTFCLSRQDIKTLPVMRSLPGTYAVRIHRRHHRPIRLVSILAASSLAIHTHGSLDMLQTCRVEHGSANMLHRLLKTRRFRSALFDILSIPDHPDPTALDVPNDDYEGLGSIIFPSMRGQKIDRGLWCRGCERSYELVRHRELRAESITRVADDGPYTDSLVRAMQYRAWSQAGLLQHARLCHSAREVIEKSWVGLH